MKAKLRFVYTRNRPDYTPEETAKLDAARLQVFGDEKDGPHGFCGMPGVLGCQGDRELTPEEQERIEQEHQAAYDRAVKHNEDLQRKLDSVYEIAGVPQRTLEQEVHEIEVDLPAFPSDGHHIMHIVEMRGVGGPYDGLLLDRVNHR